MPRGPRTAVRSSGRRLVGGHLVVLGVAGVVVGHTVAYLAVEPDGSRRASLLHETGHSYWHAAVVAAVVAAVWSIASRAVAQFRSARSDDLTPESIGQTGVRLAAFQVLVYALMETAERMAAHQPLATLFAHRLFVVGLLLQVVVAGVLVQFLRLVGRAVVAIARKLARPAARRRSAPARCHFGNRTVRSSATWDRPGPSRAPPAPA